MARNRGVLGVGDWMNRVIRGMLFGNGASFQSPPGFEYWSANMDSTVPKFVSAYLRRGITFIKLTSATVLPAYIGEAIHLVGR